MMISYSYVKQFCALLIYYVSWAKFYISCILFIIFLQMKSLKNAKNITLFSHERSGRLSVISDCIKDPAVSLLLYFTIFQSYFKLPLLVKLPRQASLSELSWFAWAMRLGPCLSCSCRSHDCPYLFPLQPQLA